MKIKSLLNSSLIGMALLAGGSATAQENNRIQPCNTYAAMEEAFALDPSAKARYEKEQAKMYTEYKQAVADKQNGKLTAAPVYTIPVVFHILHMGGNENVSDAVIHNLMDYVNKDFARTNTDANQTNEPFNSSYIDSEIHFVLAKKDPNGNCHTGINRYITTRTDWPQSGVLTNYVYTWDPTKYLNIYVVKSIVPTSTVTGGGIIVGYTYKPGTWPTGAAQDAIVYRADFLSGGDNPRSMTHEIGHWLNLAHTWGNNNNPGVSCGDDGIDDTPVTLGEFSSCPSTSVSACTQTLAAMTGLNNVQNIMNYSTCPKNFTSLQTAAMRAACASSTSGRNNLWSTTNLTATGVNAATVPCAPIASFMSTAPYGYTVCSGQTITSFRDFSYNGAVTSWSWSATNSASITNPTSSITTISFPNPGTATVTLVVSNSEGSSTASRTVIVSDGTANGLLGMESFEASGTPSNWNIRNMNNGSVTWARTTNAGSEGSASFLMDIAISPANHIDILETPIYDLQSAQNFSMTFKYAYRRQSSTQNDVFRVQMSDNCGGTWRDVFAPSAAVMASGSGETSSTNFIPTSSQWKFQDVSNHPNYGFYLASKSVRFRFYFQTVTGFGNKLYLDEINFITPDVGINEITKHIQLNLYPNPSNGSSNLNFVLSNDADIKVSITDVTGKLVSAESIYKLNAGNHNIVVNENNQLNAGIYIVNMDYNGTKLTRKLVIN